MTKRSVIARSRMMLLCESRQDRKVATVADRGRCQVHLAITVRFLFFGLSPWLNRRKMGVCLVRMGGSACLIYL